MVSRDPDSLGIKFIMILVGIAVFSGLVGYLIGGSHN
jgi:hypothetical protein